MASILSLALQSLNNPSSLSLYKQSLENSLTSQGIAPATPVYSASVFPEKKEISEVRQSVNYPVTQSMGTMINTVPINKVQDTYYSGSYNPAQYRVSDFIKTLSPRLYEALPVWSKNIANQIKESDSVDLSVPDSTTLIHEVLHKNFASKLKIPETEIVSNYVSKGPVYKYVNLFNSAWNSELSKNPELRKIDEHILQNYPSINPITVAHERFAYLGEESGIDGLANFPAKLKPFYKDVFNTTVLSKNYVSPSVDVTPVTDIPLENKFKNRTDYQNLLKSADYDYSAGEYSSSQKKITNPITKLADWVKSKLKGKEFTIKNPTKSESSDNSNSINTIARIIYGEAAGTKDRLNAMIAVANTMQNRAGTSTPDMLLKVATSPKQYSAYGGNLYNQAADPSKLTGSSKRAYEEALSVAKRLVNGELTDITGGATHYFNPKLVNPSWAKTTKTNKPIKTASIGGHDFYKSIR